jgi:GntR family transcriptional regulator, transcriptional repressor for pyruvate dehydrogenase complex
MALPTATAAPLFGHVERVPAYQIVGQSIRAAILEGRLRPGDLLPVEHQLAEQLGVTRSTVREGLRALEHAGLVERGARRRLRVAQSSHNSVGSAMHDALVLQRITYRDLWEIMMALEPTAAELAATRATPEVVEALRANLVLTAEVIDDPVRLVEADVAFHTLVADATTNMALLLARSTIARLFYPAYGEVIRRLGPGERLLAAHRQVTDAIQRGDAEGASEWMRKHIRDFRRGCTIAGIDLGQVVDRLADA